MIETLDVINIKEKGKKTIFIFPLEPKFSVADYYVHQMSPVFMPGNNLLQMYEIMSNHFS